MRPARVVSGPQATGRHTKTAAAHCPPRAALVQTKTAVCLDRATAEPYVFYGWGPTSLLYSRFTLSRCTCTSRSRAVARAHRAIQGAARPLATSAGVTWGGASASQPKQAKGVAPCSTTAQAKTLVSQSPCRTRLRQADSGRFSGADVRQSPARQRNFLHQRGRKPCFPHPTRSCFHPQRLRFTNTTRYSPRSPSSRRI